MSESTADADLPSKDHPLETVQLAVPTRLQNLSEALSGTMSSITDVPSQDDLKTTRQSSGSSGDIKDTVDGMEPRISSFYGSDAWQPMNPNDRAELTRLARQSHSLNSRHRDSIASSNVDSKEPEQNDAPYDSEADSDTLDPQNKKFDLYKWIRRTMASLDQGGIHLKTTGLVFKDVRVSGTTSSLNVQNTVGSLLLAPLRLGEFFHFGKKQPRRILHNFDGLVKSGELLVVLGRPGSGCSTLLKTLTGQLYGLGLDENSSIHYNGIRQQQMRKEFTGEVIYNQEIDKHFPHLTVGETLEHAAALRTPQDRPLNVPRHEFAKQITQVFMAVYGLSHTYNTKVGNDFVRGVSGGERKRVSIAEMALARSLVAAWDNSTRGLDSANALTFVKSLRLTADLVGSLHAVAIYQASQAIYDLFDKAVVLYDGRQIFFGRADRAKAYFEHMGWYCPPRQTTGNFLTSITNPAERQAIEGYEHKVPRTPEDFEAYWHNSPEYAELRAEIDAYEQKYPIGHGGELQSLRDYKSSEQARHTRQRSPYVVSVPMQIRLNAKRAFQRVWNNKAGTLMPIISNAIMALIIGSVFFGSPQATGAFTSKGAVVFFAILLNALTAITEINSLYDQRPIVEKHKSYAFYHPSTEAIAGILLDLPIKFMVAVAFNVVLYFMAGLRREPAQFFIFFLITFTATLAMVSVFRTVAAVTKSVSSAMALAGVMVLAIVVYTGFIVPVKYMHPWFSWIRWINPIFYSFEGLIANEFHAREFACSAFVPAYRHVTGDTFICNQRGAVAGDLTVSGDAYIAAAYEYTYSHLWRNVGILFGFLFFFMAMYFIAVELNSETSSTAEVLVFRRGKVPGYLQNMANGKVNDEEHAPEKAAEAPTEEKGSNVKVIPPQTDVFTWRDVVYDIKIKDEPRRLLNHISGYVKPGTLTALMGTSGAGKTTLLDVLAQRTSIGVVTGSMFVNGTPLDTSFQRKTGYVQQQDLHLETATVRESLRFSAVLRQPKSISKQEKYDYVEDVIKMLNMHDFAEAVVGRPGEGLNVEQRKLLTIGVELAAKPKLLLFLDEPTSGLDEQSSWAICNFLRKLADSGQAVLCTIHQPSATLFQQFDRLLFLRKGGSTVYFGKIGENSQTLLDYFEQNGARTCSAQENPAEYMLEVVEDETRDWVQIWNDSREAKGVEEEIDNIHNQTQSTNKNDEQEDQWTYSEFAMPFTQQLYEVTYRVFQQYWRMPAYIMAKMILGCASGLFIGFSFFNANTSLQGLQNVLYSLFMVITIFITLVQQIMPLFVTQRTLYEARERPSKAYSWKAFLCANIIVEIPYQIVAGLLVYATFYYAVVGIQDSERQGLVMLFCVIFFIYASTFAHMCISALPDAQTAGAIGTLFFGLSLIFNGVMQPPDKLPGFWIFMYRVSPLTYWVSGMASTMLHARRVICSSDELSVFAPPVGQSCASYMAPYLSVAPGYLLQPNATERCEYCAVGVADTFLAGSEIFWADRWRNFGVMWAYVGFNVAVAVLLYYVFRVRIGGTKQKGLMRKKAKKN